MTVTYRPAKREAIPLLIGVTGGTGGGKTMSALLLARGIAGGKPFAFLDTENGRGLHYADEFPEMQHARLDAPFRPERYIEAIKAADGQGFPVIVVDSASHEWAGDGGVTDWQLDEYQRLGAKDAIKLLSWSVPKQGHKRFITQLLQVKAHVILCLRAEPKVDMVKGEDGKTKIVPKQSLTGLDGWMPITEKSLPFELTLSVLLMADAPGVPRPIKMPEKLRPFFPLDRPITEQTGVALAAWAAGPASATTPVAPVLINAAQRKTLGDAAKEAGLPADRFRQIVADITGVTEGKLIPADKVDALLEAIRAVSDGGDDLFGALSDQASAQASEQPVDPPAEAEPGSPFQIPASVRAGAA